MEKHNKAVRAPPGLARGRQPAPAHQVLLAGRVPAEGGAVLPLLRLRAALRAVQQVPELRAPPPPARAAAGRAAAAGAPAACHLPALTRPTPAFYYSNVSLTAFGLRYSRGGRKSVPSDSVWPLVKMRGRISVLELYLTHFKFRPFGESCDRFVRNKKKYLS